MTEETTPKGRLSQEQHAATVRDSTQRIRDSIGFALAEKNIPHEPTWTLLVPQALDNIDAALDELAALARTTRTEDEWVTMRDLLRRAEAAEARADELQRERDEAQEKNRKLSKLVMDAEADMRKARREADQLRETAQILGESVLQWVDHPGAMDGNAMRAICGRLLALTPFEDDVPTVRQLRAALDQIDQASRDYEAHGHIGYLARAALAGVQAHGYGPDAGISFPDDGGEQADCDGSSDCAATRHMHGCFADKGDCDHPSEHDGVQANCDHDFVLLHEGEYRCDKCGIGSRDGVQADRATICEECGSGILDGEHIADYPCSQADNKDSAPQDQIDRGEAPARTFRQLRSAIRQNTAGAGTDLYTILYALDNGHDADVIREAAGRLRRHLEALEAKLNLAADNKDSA